MSSREALRTQLDVGGAAGIASRKSEVTGGVTK